MEWMQCIVQRERKKGRQLLQSKLSTDIPLHHESFFLHRPNRKPIQYNTINTLYNTIQYISFFRQYNTIHLFLSTIQYNTIQYILSTIQYNTSLSFYNTIQYIPMQNYLQARWQSRSIENLCNRPTPSTVDTLLVRHLYNTIQYNTIQYNTIQQNTIEYRMDCDRIDCIVLNCRENRMVYCRETKERREKTTSTSTHTHTHTHTRTIKQCNQAE